MPPVNMQDPAIQRMLATADPSYIAYLQSIGAIGPDFVQGAPPPSLPVSSGMVPGAPNLSPMPPAPAQNPMMAELARYFGL